MWSQRVRHDLWTKQQILRSLSSLWFNYVQLLKQYFWGFPGGSEVKVSACNARNLGSIPGSGRSPGEGNGNALQYSCLENSMDREAWWATVHGVAKSPTWLSNFHSLIIIFRRYINILFNDKCTSNINKWSDFYLTSEIFLVLKGSSNNKWLCCNMVSASMNTVSLYLTMHSVHWTHAR